MISFAEALSCRRRALLGYFGEELAEDCGNCDVCENPPETYDATVDAQKALSAVFRLRERFGLGYVVDVLRGSTQERILANGHVRQLVHLGYLRIDVADYSTLKLMPAARAVLTGDERVTLARPPAPRPKAEKAPKRSRAVSKVLETDEQAELFERLRELRRRLAAEQSVPAYVVFADAALADMARRVPATREEFLEVSGGGAAKLERYGDVFLAEIAKSGAE